MISFDWVSFFFFASATNSFGVLPVLDWMLSRYAWNDISAILSRDQSLADLSLEFASDSCWTAAS
jgi:hypothetical protein